MAYSRLQSRRVHRVHHMPAFVRILVSGGLINAMIWSTRTRQAEREIARYLTANGGKFTDEAERDIERRFLGRRRTFSQRQPIIFVNGNAGDRLPSLHLKLLFRDRLPQHLWRVFVAVEHAKTRFATFQPSLVRLRSQRLAPSRWMR